MRKFLDLLQTHKEFLLIGPFIGVMLMFLLTSNATRTFLPGPFQLTLTDPGCAFIDSKLSLNSKIEHGSCVVTVNFVPNNIGAGGSVYLAEDQSVELSDSQVVGFVALPRPDIHWTHKQKISVFWVALCGLFIVGSMASVFFMPDKKTPKEHKDSED